DELGLDAGQNEEVHPGNRYGPGGGGERAVAEDDWNSVARVDVLALPDGLIQGRERLAIRPGERLQQRLLESRATVIWVVEPFLRRRQVDRDRAIHESIEAMLLLGKAAAQVFWHGRLRMLVAIG